MAATRMALSVLSKNHYNVSAWTRLLKRKPSFVLGPASYRVTLHNQMKTKQVKQNLELISHGDQKVLIGDKDVKRPLLLLIAWLAAKRQHYMKLVDFYMEQGFDCVVVTTSPTQLMWPIKGSQLIAADVLSFLEKNSDYNRIIIHGFSVGGYIYSEALEIIKRDPERYASLIKRIAGQIWDSAVDVSELSIGTPKAVFPNNSLLQSMLKKYLEYHMKAFYKQSTQYYIAASKSFYENIVKAPALFFLSNSDPIGTVKCNKKVIESWRASGIETYVKIFERSPHVGHFRKYPKEYVTELFVFLNKLNLIQDEEKIKARIGSSV